MPVGRRADTSGTSVSGGDSVPDERLCVGRNGFQGSPARIPPFRRPVQCAQYQHLRDIHIQFRPQTALHSEVVDQSSPYLAIALLFQDLTLANRKRDLPGVADGSRRVVGYVQRVTE